MKEILNFFPSNISELIYNNIYNDFQELEEIRIRIRKTYYFKIFQL